MAAHFAGAKNFMHIFAVSRRQELKHKSALTGGVISGAAGQNRFVRAEASFWLCSQSEKYIPLWMYSTKLHEL
jgi:hypothetical protein